MNSNDVDVKERSNKGGKISKATTGREKASKMVASMGDQNSIAHLALSLTSRTKNTTGLPSNKKPSGRKKKDSASKRTRDAKDGMSQSESLHSARRGKRQESLSRSDNSKSTRREDSESLSKSEILLTTRKDSESLSKSENLQSSRKENRRKRGSDPESKKEESRRKSRHGKLSQSEHKRSTRNGRYGGLLMSESLHASRTRTNGLSQSEHMASCSEEASKSGMRISSESPESAMPEQGNQEVPRRQSRVDPHLAGLALQLVSKSSTPKNRKQCKGANSGEIGSKHLHSSITAGDESMPSLQAFPSSPDQGAAREARRQTLFVNRARGGRTSTSVARGSSLPPKDEPENVKGNDSVLRSNRRNRRRVDSLPPTNRLGASTTRLESLPTTASTQPQKETDTTDSMLMTTNGDNDASALPNATDSGNDNGAPPEPTRVTKVKFNDNPVEHEGEDVMRQWYSIEELAELEATEIATLSLVIQEDGQDHDFCLRGFEHIVSGFDKKEHVSKYVRGIRIKYLMLSRKQAQAETDLREELRTYSRSQTKGDRLTAKTLAKEDAVFVTEIKKEEEKRIEEEASPQPPTGTAQSLVAGMASLFVVKDKSSASTNASKGVLGASGFLSMMNGSKTSVDVLVNRR